MKKAIKLPELRENMMYLFDIWELCTSAQRLSYLAYDPLNEPILEGPPSGT